MKQPTHTGSKNTKAKTNGHARRKYPSWIDRFVEATSGLETPKIFRQWAAINAVGAAMQQKVFIITKGSALYPNLYVMLVGPPAIGKSETIKALSPYLQGLKGFNLASKSVSGASLSIEMSEAKCSWDVNTKWQETLTFNSLLLMSDELQALMHKYDTALAAMLTTFYDCIRYSESRVTRDTLVIENPQLSMLAGTTPSHLMETIPEGVWQQGLMSRTILVYADQKEGELDIFEETETFSEDLADDMKIIYSTVGQIDIEEDYRQVYMEWKRAGYPPRPGHPRLDSYCGRRGSQVLKLSMISSVDRGAKMVMQRQDFDRALGWLLQAEQYIPNLFFNIKSGTTVAIDEVIYRCKGQIITEGQLGRLLANSFPASQVPSIIKILEGSGQVRVVGFEGNTKKYQVV